MLNKYTGYKYETPYMGPFVITWCFNNGTVNFSIVRKQLCIIYVQLSHINIIQALKVLTQKICMTKSTYDRQLYNFLLY